LVLDGSGWLAPRLARFTTGNGMELNLSEAEWAPRSGLDWRGKSRHTAGIRFPDRPVRNESL
jgi:hypothetical protein